MICEPRQTKQVFPVQNKVTLGGSRNSGGSNLRIGRLVRAILIRNGFQRPYRSI